MADYTSNLKTWGATGAEYPDGYSYLEGEQPVDDWDNFIRYNAIEDLDHLINVTNRRIESNSGTAHPSNPESGHLSYLSDEERLYHRDTTLGSWVGLVRLDGDTMEGSLDMGGFSIENIGGFNLDADGDLSGNDLNDSSAGTTLYDASAGKIPLGAIAENQVTVNAGSHLSGGGTISLGGSVDVSVDDDFLLNDGDEISGELEGQRPASSRIFTATDSDTGDKLSLRVSGNDSFQLVGYDSSDGTWDYNSALSYDPGTSRWGFGSLPNVNGNNMATQTWVNSSADVPNADQADNADTVGGLGPGEVNHFASSDEISVGAGRFAVADDTGALYFEDGN